TPIATPAPSGSGSTTPPWTGHVKHHCHPMHPPHPIHPVCPQYRDNDDLSLHDNDNSQGNEQNRCSEPSAVPDPSDVKDCAWPKPPHQCCPLMLTGTKVDGDCMGPPIKLSCGDHH